MIKVFFSGVVTSLLCLAATQMALYGAEVVIYGGNASAVTAAVAAARNGADTVLVNPGPHLGGMVSGGLGVTDAGRIASIGGIANEFFLNLGQFYKHREAAFRHEPHVAEMLFRTMLERERITIVKGIPLAEENGVVKQEGGRITAIRLADGQIIEGNVFIDASYEGDLMAQAGVRYSVGRESRQTYGEPLAGVRNAIQHGDRALALDEAGVLPGIYEGDIGKTGEGDSKIMSYNFRLCMTKIPENQAPVTRPERYDPRHYTLMSRLVFKQPQATLNSIFSIGEIPGGKADFNNIGSISSNLLNASWAYPEASYAKRREISQAHRDYLQGLLWFLQNDTSVPPVIRESAREWAFAKDEFAENGHWPHQLYIREARRMVGEKVMTQHDLQNEITQPDSIGMGSYMMDSHYVQRTLSGDKLVSEGTLSGDHRVVPYQISYRSLVPKREECPNLLVPVCMSASHVALASMRMEPVYMILGHSAGTAAAIVAKNRGAVQDLDYATLRARLLEEKQVLEYEIKGQIALETMEGIVVDEGDAKLKGHWLKSTSGEPFVGVGYIHDNNTDKGNRTATYTIPVPFPGTYEVRLYSARGGNRSTNTKVTVTGSDGAQTLFVNQKEVLPQYYTSLGNFPFAKEAKVEISNEGSNGVVVADAVQLVPSENASGAGATSSAEPEATEGDLLKISPPEELSRIDLEWLNGIVVDDEHAEAHGVWMRAASVFPFVGEGYRSDIGQEKGTCDIRYVPNIPQEGDYAVWLYYPAHANRSPEVPVSIRFAEGEEKRTVDMRKSPPDGLPALHLGTFRFKPGEEGYVEISNGNTSGVVAADAVQWVPVEKSPNASRASANPLQSPVPSLAKGVEMLKGRILDCQLPDGALRMTFKGNGVRVVPYFSNIAAIALLETGDPAVHKAVRDWINWYVVRQEPDGTIYDFVGTVSRYGKADHRDSTDSYASTFLQLLWRYSQAEGYDKLTPEMRKAGEKALAAIELTIDAEDGLTWAKPEYKVKYLMDNLEVCLGLEEGSRLFQAMGRADLVQHARAMRDRIAASLSRYWQPQLGYFSWAKGSGGNYHIGMKRWYPDGIIHLYAITVLRETPAGLWEILQNAFGNEPKLTPDWWLRASKVTGSAEEQERFLTASLRFAAELQKDGQLNRLGGTLLGLTEDRETRTSVAVSTNGVPSPQNGN